MRPRTAQKIGGLIDVHIAEEIYYREWIAMGLDQDDTVIRRRLRRKMGFISEDAAAVTEPVAGRGPANFAAVGRAIGIEGLSATRTDVLARLAWLDGTSLPCG